MTVEKVMGISNAYSVPRLCGLLARDPSSLSRVMHNAGFSQLDVPYRYVSFATECTAEAIAAMRALGLRGYSLTIPHKERAVRLVDSLSPEAREIGAINTAVNDRGTVFGENTDWRGVAAAFEEVGVALSAKRVLLIGAGGAARAAAYTMRRMCAESVFVWSRARGREFVASVPSVQLVEGSLPSLEDFDVLINATPMGSEGVEGIFPFSLRDLTDRHVVLDMVLQETELIARARAAGAKAISGIRMLLHQGLKQFELFTERSAPRETMERALLEEYERINSLPKKR